MELQDSEEKVDICRVPFKNASAITASVCASAVISVRIEENVIVVFSSQNSSNCFIYTQYTLKSPHKQSTIIYTVVQM